MDLSWNLPFLGVLRSMEPILWLLQFYRSICPWVFLALYLLMSFSLHTIARRRKIWWSWLSFVPIGSIWILGCISDQYRQAKFWRRSSRRKVMLVLELICILLVIVLCVNLLEAYRTLTEDLEHIYRFSDLIDEIFDALENAAWAALLMAAGLLICAIGKWICCFDLFTSCDPENRWIYLLFGIFFPHLAAIFVFLCRKKDLGLGCPIKQS